MTEEFTALSIPEVHPYTIDICQHCPILSIDMDGGGYCKVINKRINFEEYTNRISPFCPLWVFRNIRIELSNDLKKEYWGINF